MIRACLKGNDKTIIFTEAEGPSEPARKRQGLVSPLAQLRRPFYFAVVICLARYRYVHIEIWGDPDFQSYTVEGKLVFIYLFTNYRIGESGIYVITPRTISNDTGVSEQTVSELLRNGYRNALYDWDNHAIFMTEYRRYNAGGNPEKIQKAINKERDKVCTPLWSEFDSRYTTDGKPLVNGSLESETESAIETDIDIDKVFDDFNELGPGPKHKSRPKKAKELMIKLCTEGDASGEIWDNDKFATAFKIYADKVSSGEWTYKWPSITDLLSRTFYQKTGPGLLRFLPREGYDPEKEVGFDDGKTRTKGRKKPNYDKGL